MNATVTFIYSMLVGIMLALTANTVVALTTRFGSALAFARRKTRSSSRNDAHGR